MQWHLDSLELRLRCRLKVKEWLNAAVESFTNYSFVAGLDLPKKPKTDWSLNPISIRLVACMH